MIKIVIAHGLNSIEVLHSITPFILSTNKKNDWNWRFVNYKFYDIYNLTGDILILVRKYHNSVISNNDLASDIKKLRKRFRKIIYFDDSASPTDVNFNLLYLVDSYWKRAILKNLSLYQVKLYGGRLFSDYYYKKFNIKDINVTKNNNVANKETDFSKLKIAWNIGIGAFPLNENFYLDNYYPLLRKLITSMTILPTIKPIYFFINNYLNRMKKSLKNQISFKNKTLKISSRFTDRGYSNSVGFQRNLILKKVLKNNNFLTSKLNKKEFTSEMHGVFGVLSAFGWGEICYRDFEACLGGSYLIKPDMSHLSTWPNIYKKDMYHSLSWDFSDLENIENIFDDVENCESAVNKSRLEYLNSLELSVCRCIKMIENVLK